LIKRRRCSGAGSGAPRAGLWPWGPAQRARAVPNHGGQLIRTACAARTPGRTATVSSRSIVPGAAVARHVRGDMVIDTPLILSPTAAIGPWWLPGRWRCIRTPKRAASRLIVGLAQRAQVQGQVVRGDQGAGVVLAQHPAAAVQGVLVQVPGRLHLTQRAQVLATSLFGDAGAALGERRSAALDEQCWSRAAMTES